MDAKYGERSDAVIKLSTFANLNCLTSMVVNP